MCGQTESVYIGLVRYSVVAHERVSQHQNLAAIAGIRQGLWIPHHPGVEDDFARHGRRGAEAEAGVRATVFEHQGTRGVLRAQDVIFCSSTEGRNEAREKHPSRCDRVCVFLLGGDVDGELPVVCSSFGGRNTEQQGVGTVVVGCPIFGGVCVGVVSSRNTSARRNRAAIDKRS